MKTANSKTQKEKLKDAFERIKEDVTPADRTVCAEQENVSKMTISNCLNGYITNIEKAIKILNVFRQRIAERDKQLVA